MKENITIVRIVVVAIIAISAIYAFLPYFEAKAFNDCTGGHASYFTAFFTELRIQDCSLLRING